VSAWPYGPDVTDGIADVSDLGVLLAIAALAIAFPRLGDRWFWRIERKWKKQALGLRLIRNENAQHN
jgi:hypothetical protein